MSMYELAWQLKRQYPENTVVRLVRKNDHDTLDYVELPGRWRFEQVIAHTPVRAMWESRGLSIDPAGDCYLAVM